MRRIVVVAVVLGGLALTSCAAAIPPRKPGGPSAPRTYFPPERAQPAPSDGPTSIARPG